MHFLPDAHRTKSMSTEGVRGRFLVEGLLIRGEINLRRIDLDRVVLGGVVPTSAPLDLPNLAELLAQFFCERRELGVLNIGGAGTVTVDGASYTLGNKDLVYLSRGSPVVSFTTENAAAPARFYLVSYPAHAEHPTARVTSADVQAGEIGSAEPAHPPRVRRHHPTGGHENAPPRHGRPAPGTRTLSEPRPACA